MHFYNFHQSFKNSIQLVDITNFTRIPIDSQKLFGFLFSPYTCNKKCLVNQIVPHLPYLNLTCFILLLKNDNLELLQAYLAYAPNANEIMCQARLDIIQFDRPTT